MMTLGEAKIYAKDNCRINQGGVELSLPRHKERMSYKEGCNYYNKKLLKYWIESFVEKIPAEKTSEVLEYFKGIIN